MKTCNVPRTPKYVQRVAVSHIASGSRISMSKCRLLRNYPPFFRYFVVEIGLLQNSSCIQQHKTLKIVWYIPQIGLSGVTIIVACCYYLRFLRGIAFYVLFLIVGGTIILFPIDNQIAIVVVVEFLTKDLQKVTETLLNGIHANGNLLMWLF